MSLPYKLPYFSLSWSFICIWPFTFSLEKVQKHNYRFSFFPEEIDDQTFLNWAQQDRRMELETDDCIMKDTEWYKEYQKGE